MKKKFIKLGRLKDYAQVCRQHKIAAIFAYSDILSAEEIYNIVEFCRRQGIYFRYHSEAFSKNIFWEDLDALNLIGLKEQKFSELSQLLKRAADLALVIPALLIASPLMLLIYLGIKITSPGPAIYRQTRITCNGQEFQFLKFRSMPVDSEKDGARLALRDQKHRTTRFGYFLRKTSLDELPQLFNVLRGEMSLVGPRPERPVFHEKYLQTVPRWNERLAVKGGITGWAQLNGRAELTASPQEKLEYDVYYIENWSLLFDILILWRTFWHVLKQKDVY